MILTLRDDITSFLSYGVIIREYVRDWLDELVRSLYVFNVFKLCLLTFRSLRGIAPRKSSIYLADLCCSTSTCETTSKLQSAANGDHTFITFDHLADAHQVWWARIMLSRPIRAWKRLPLNIRAQPVTPSKLSNEKLYDIYCAFPLSTLTMSAS